MSKGLIISGGHVNRDLLLRLLKNKESLTVGVDGGMNALWVLGHKPDYILGDFDSCLPEAHRHFQKEGVPEITFDAKKDMTDTDLAIDLLIEKGVSEITILGGTGTRLDHTFGNLMMLMKYRNKAHICIVDETNRIQVAGKDMVITKDGYRYLSLVPVSDCVKGVTLKGVKYPLTSADLIRESTYSISNEIDGDRCNLYYSQGDMLIIQSND